MQQLREEAVVGDRKQEVVRVGTTLLLEAVLVLALLVLQVEPEEQV